MLVNLKQKIDDKELNQLRVKFKDEIGLKDEDFYHQGALKEIAEEDHRLASINAEESIWLEVNLYNSYYGVGYERGDISLYVRCAEWLEKHIPNCKVYYGHDVDDESIILFDVVARERLIKMRIRS